MSDNGKLHYHGASREACYKTFASCRSLAIIWAERHPGSKKRKCGDTACQCQRLYGYDGVRKLDYDKPQASYDKLRSRFVNYRHDSYNMAEQRGIDQRMLDAMLEQVTLTHPELGEGSAIDREWQQEAPQPELTRLPGLAVLNGVSATVLTGDTCLLAVEHAPLLLTAVPGAFAVLAALVAVGGAIKMDRSDR